MEGCWEQPLLLSVMALEAVASVFRGSGAAAVRCEWRAESFISARITHLLRRGRLGHDPNQATQEVQLKLFARILTH